jgi:hypothetical protein
MVKILPRFQADSCKNILAITPDEAIRKMWRRIPRCFKATFVSVFFFGLLSHGYIMLNKLPGHDELAFLVRNMDIYWLGRWFLRYPSAISSQYSLPLFNGFLSLLYIALAVCLLVASLKIKDSLASVLIAGLMVSFPVVTSTFTFMYTADSYFFALLLSCLAFFLAERYKYGFIAAVIPLVLSLGTYQAYFGIAASLMVIVLIIDAADNKQELAKIVLKGLRFGATLTASLLAYLFIAKHVVSSKGGTLDEHMGIDQMGNISFSSIPGLVREAYEGVFRFFFTEGYMPAGYFNIHHKLTRGLFVVAFALTVFLLVLRCVQSKAYRDPKRLAVLAVLLLLFPLSCGIIFVMAPVHRHLLMLYGLVLVLVFPVVVQAKRPSENTFEGGATWTESHSWHFLLGHCCHDGFHDIQLCSCGQQDLFENDDGV